MAVLTLAAAKTHLNITSSTHDTELGTFITAAEAAIAVRCGPLESTAVTERVDTAAGRLLLSRPPVISLTSVTPVGGSALTLGDLYLNTRAGVVCGQSGSVPSGTYDVVYAAGRTTCPEDLVLAVKELVRHLWDTQRGPTRRPGSTASELTGNTIPGAAYLLPFRVSELIAPHVQPGFA